MTDSTPPEPRAEGPSIDALHAWGHLNRATPPEPVEARDIWPDKGIEAAISLMVWLDDCDPYYASADHIDIAAVAVAARAELAALRADTARVPEGLNGFTPQKVAEYAVWYARKKKGPAAEVAAALLEEFPWLREPLERAALATSPERSEETRDD